MVIFLTILKWIFNIIAILLMLVLLLSLVVLLVPIRYRIAGEYKDNHGQYTYCVSWLLRAVTVKKDMDSQEVWLRLFGIRFRQLGENEEPREKTRKKKQTQPEDEIIVKGNEESVFEITPEEQEAMERMRKERKEKTEQEAEQKKQTKGKKKKKEKKENRGFSFKSISSIIDFIRDKENRPVLVYLKNKAGWLMKYLMPNKICGIARFGFDDPANTGMVLGLVSLLPFVYNKKVHVYPNFQEKELEVQGIVEGHIRLWFIVDLGLELYRNKDIRRCKRNYDKLKEEL